MFMVLHGIPQMPWGNAQLRFAALDRFRRFGEMILGGGVVNFVDLSSPRSVGEFNGHVLAQYEAPLLGRSH